MITKSRTLSPWQLNGCQGLFIIKKSIKSIKYLTKLMHYDIFLKSKLILLNNEVTCEAVAVYLPEL